MSFFSPLLAFITAAIAYTDVIMMSIVTILTILTTTIVIVKIQLVCVWYKGQPERSNGQP